jgi:hypothetical protein
MRTTRTLLLLAALAAFVASCHAQVVWKVCVTRTEGGKMSQVCQALSDDVVFAVTQRAAATPTGGKAGSTMAIQANVILSEMRDVYRSLVSSHPSPRLKSARDAARKAVRDSETAALPPPPTAEVVAAAPIAEP